MFEALRKFVPQTAKNYYHFVVAFIAALFYRFPAYRLKVIGVTGTDGKTTTTHMVYHLLHEAGEKVSMISTIEARVGNRVVSTGLHTTTPNPFQMQKLLREMVDVRSEIAVIEMTSHGLDQNRVAFIPVYTGAIANITHEHLDYHGSFEQYRSAKAKILRRTKYRVLNCDDPSFENLKVSGSGQRSCFGLKKEADFQASDISETTNGVNFKVSYLDKQKKKVSARVRLPLLGRFNVYNSLCALSVLSTFGLEPKEVAAYFESFQSPRGRMQMVREGQDFFVIIDFAHTPAALSNALKSLRQYKHNRLIAVFGAASERDKMKRPVMGKISTELADLSIFTSEDPRGEDPAKIIEEIVSGAIEAGGAINETYWKIPDRAEAINLAVRNLAKKGDIVAIFGKGHEESINIKGKELPWSDEEVSRKAIRARSIQ